jgi:hypothetical protein
MNNPRTDHFSLRIWVNNGQDNHRVMPEELSNYTAQGYIEGRIPMPISDKLQAHLDSAHLRAGKLKKYGYTDEMVQAERGAGNRWCSWHKKFEKEALFGSRKQLICNEGWNEAGQSRRYGVDRDWYRRKLEEQDGHCAFCPMEYSPTAKKKEGRLCIDHDHHCCPSKNKACGKCVRGLLCAYCNQELGRVETYLEQGQMIPTLGTWLEKALAYLQSYQRDYSLLDSDS